MPNLRNPQAKKTTDFFFHVNMNIQVQIQVCRACLKAAESTNLEEYGAESEILKNYLDVIGLEVTIDFFLKLDFQFCCPITLFLF
jgi:hypothetical protein